MQAFKSLVYILFLPLLIFTLIISAIQWADLSRLNAEMDSAQKNVSGLTASLIKDMIDSGSINIMEAYPLYDLTKRHNIYRALIFDRDGNTINDTLSKDLLKQRWLTPEHIKDVLNGKMVFLKIKEKDTLMAVTLSKIEPSERKISLREDRGFILGLMMELPYQKPSVSGAFIVISVGSIIFLGILLTALSSYLRTQRKPKEDTSEADFILNTFHNLVAGLKDSERQLELLKRLAEERAEVIESYNENILESVPSGVISLDSSQEITKINSSGERILELKRGSVIGKDITDVLKGQLGQLLAKRTNIERAEVQYETLSGKRIWLGYALTPLFDQNKNAIGKLFIFTDLTELKALESQAELRQRLSSLGEMATGIAHELRNPMGVIAGYTRLLEKKVDSSILPQVEAISKEVSLMDRIINDFLSFARPWELNLSSLNLYEIIEDSVKNLLTGDTDIEVSIDVDRSLIIEGDRVFLRQAFTNLIQNSIEAMDVESPRRRLFISCLKTTDALEITFSDTGHGIQREIRDKIFLPFFTTKEKGTGLGLAIVHRLITAHRGSIEVGDTDIGASFRIRLPIRQAEVLN